MSSVTTLHLRRKGRITLPVALRRKYGFKEGDFFTLEYLGSRILILSPGKPEIDPMAGKLSNALSEQGESLESMLQTLREERERYTE